MLSDRLPDATPSSAGRVAVISCIHGNLAAFEAALDDIAARTVQQIICLGDLVGYGPHPNEVIALVQKRDIHTIQGCWDEGIGLDRAHCGCTFLSDEDARLGETAFAWTSERVLKKHKAYLRELPHGVQMRTPRGVVVFVHGSPRSTSEYLTESTHDLVLLERAAGAGCDVLVCGHTHVPYVRRVEGTLRVTAQTGLKDAFYKDRDPGLRLAPKEITLAPKLIVNAGSIGEPRHGSPESTYVILDTNTWDVELHRVAYDVARTVRAMRKLDLPAAFVERLTAGRELVGKHKDITCAC